MKKRILLSFLIALVLACVAGFYYLNKVFLPTFLREKITTGLSAITSGKVTVEAIRFNLFRGIVVSGITFFDKDDAGKELCAVKDISATILFLPFQKEKYLMIPSLSIDSLTIHLLRQTDNTLNISYLIDSFKGTGKTKTPPLLVKNVHLKDVTARFTDASFDPAISMTLIADRISCNLGLTKALLSFEGSIARNDQISRFSGQAQYAYLSRALDGSLFVDKVRLSTWTEYLKNLPLALEKGDLADVRIDYLRDEKNTTINSQVSLLGFAIERGDLSLKETLGSGTCLLEIPADDLERIKYSGQLKIDTALFSIRGGATAEGKIEGSSCGYAVENNMANLSVNLNISGVTAQKDKIKVSGGNAEAQAKIAVPFSPQENAVLTYEGAAKIKNADIEGLDHIGKVSSVTSDLAFKPGEITIVDATMVLLEAPARAAGTFKQNTLTLDLSGNFDLEKIKAVLPKDIKMPAFEISGTTETKLRVVSDTAQTTAPLISGEATLENVGLAWTESALNFEADAGKLKFDIAGETLEWHFGAIKFKDGTYAFDGTLKNFKAPEVKTAIATKDLKVDAEVVKLGNKLRIDTCKGRYKGSDFDLKGVYHLDNETTALSIAGVVDLADIPDADLAGRCSVSAEASGPVKNHRLWSIRAKAKSDKLKAYGYAAQNVSLDYVQAKETGFVNSLTFDAYSGKGLIEGRLTPFEAEPGYIVRGIFQDIDLGALKADTPHKDETFSGILSLKFNLQGQGRNLKSLRGNGAFNVKDGNLLEFNPLKGLGNFLFIPRFSNLIFTSAAGDFEIKDGFVSTDNVEMMSPGLGLLIEGAISFDGELDFLVNSQIPLTQAAGGIVGEDVAKAGSLSAIKVTGTVKEPKYQLQAIGENIVKKLGDLFSNILP